MADERQIAFVNRAGKVLHGVVSGPADGGSCLVMCYPLTDERKCAQRAYVSVARALADRRIAALRFDYSGCGNSEGRFEDSSLDDWISDTVCAFEKAREIGCGKVAAMGLRLGANIALCAADCWQGCRELLLWNVIVDTGRYLQAEKRRNSVLSMFAAQHRDERNETGSNGTCDLAGYAVGAVLAAELQDRDELDPAVLGKDPRIQLGTVSPVAPREAPRLTGRQPPMLYARTGAFWNLSDLRNIDDFVDCTVRHVVRISQ